MVTATDRRPRLINARSDTVASKPSYRSSLKHRRCLVLADGLFEGQKLGSKKQPHYFRLCHGKPFAFAGLWERWEKGGSPVESCTSLTTDANELLRPVHEWMPVILGPKDYVRWLDPAVQKTDVLQPLLRPYPADLMTGYPVSPVVNNPRNDTPRCIESAAKRTAEDRILCHARHSHMPACATPVKSRSPKQDLLR
jgi:putative SOS response-associated peptidase YedK